MNGDVNESSLSLLLKADTFIFELENFFFNSAAAAAALFSMWKNTLHYSFFHKKIMSTRKLCIVICVLFSFTAAADKLNGRILHQRPIPFTPIFSLTLFSSYFAVRIVSSLSSSHENGNRNYRSFSLSLVSFYLFCENGQRIKGIQPHSAKKRKEGKNGSIAAAAAIISNYRLQLRLT
jgi:hypothetical protein